MAKLHFRYGAMNCGKTTSLLQVANNYEERGMSVAIVKPDTDTKGQNKVVSRLGIEREVDVMLRKKDSVPERLGGMSLHCVLVDEAQFITRDQADEFLWYAVNKNTPVIAYGLRTDFQTRGFPGATRLLELAHELQELKTICRCGKKAILNGRLVDGQFVREGSQVAIDGEQQVEYEALCAQDYGNLVRQA